MLASLTFAAAFLTKGPISFLVLGVLLSYSIFFKTINKNWFKHAAVFIFISILPLIVVDIWHWSLKGSSFWMNYINIRLLPWLNMEIPIDPNYAGHDHFHYIKIFLNKNWPWLPFVIIGLFIPFYKKEVKLYPGTVVGFLITFGFILGFSLLKTKADWWLNAYYGGVVLLAASSLYFVITENKLKYIITPVIQFISILFLFINSIFPSIFLSKRPMEKFFSNAELSLGQTIKNNKIATCYNVRGWIDPFMSHYYLGSRLVECTQRNETKYSIIDVNQYAIAQNEKIIYSIPPIYIVQNENKK